MRNLLGSAGDNHGHAQQLFLKERNAECAFENRIEQRMQRFLASLISITHVETTRAFVSRWRNDHENPRRPRAEKPFAEHAFGRHRVRRWTVTGRQPTRL